MSSTVSSVTPRFGAIDLVKHDAPQRERDDVDSFSMPINGEDHVNSFTVSITGEDRKKFPDLLAHTQQDTIQVSLTSATGRSNLKVDNQPEIPLGFSERESPASPVADQVIELFSTMLSELPQKVDTYLAAVSEQQAAASKILGWLSEVRSGRLNQARLEQGANEVESQLKLMLTTPQAPPASLCPDQLKQVVDCLIYDRPGQP